MILESLRYGWTIRLIFFLNKGGLHFNTSVHKQQKLFICINNMSKNKVRQKGERHYAMYIVQVPSSINNLHWTLYTTMSNWHCPLYMYVLSTIWGLITRLLALVQCRYMIQYDFLFAGLMWSIAWHFFIYLNNKSGGSISCFF